MTKRTKPAPVHMLATVTGLDGGCLAAWVACMPKNGGRPIDGVATNNMYRVTCSTCRIAVGLDMPPPKLAPWSVTRRKRFTKAQRDKQDAWVKKEAAKLKKRPTPNKEK